MIDTHCHIDDPQYADDLASFLALQQQEGVEKILVPSINLDSVSSVLNVCEQFPNYLYPAFGLHPEEVNETSVNQLPAIKQALLDWQHSLPADYTYRGAIGEIGLDYHFDTTFKDAQQQVFLQQLLWAREMNMPVMIHMRDATEDTLRIIRQANAMPLLYNNKPAPPLRGVMHCYSGSLEIAKQIVDMGLYLGIGGVLTFKNCKLKEILPNLPIERILLETDAPYMAPVPYRGKRNESRWMSLVVDMLADIYHLPCSKIDEITTKNAQVLFGLL